MDSIDKTLAAFLAVICAILVTASAVLGIVLLEALTGLHIGATIVAAAIGGGYGIIVWGWCHPRK